MKSILGLIIGLGFFIVLIGFLLYPEEGEIQFKKNQIYQIVREKFLDNSGRIKAEGNGMGRTTSESQSYGLLMAVSHDNKADFDKIWGWTKNNLQTRGDHLFSWLWENGGIRDTHSATDADQDIALALLLAARQWGDSSYDAEARNIMRDIWDKETKEINGKRYLAAGDWGPSEGTGLVVNPSYLSPYIYKIFAQRDPDHEWENLIESSYELWQKCSSQAGMQRDWCKIDNEGKIDSNFTQFGNADPSIYSFDAIRTPYRIALDYKTFSDPRAKNFLFSNHLFALDLGRTNKIYAVYDSKGRPLVDYDSLAHYGAQIGNFSATDRFVSSRIFREKILPTNIEAISFYDISWIWFGLNLYSEDFPQQLKNLLL